MKLNKTIIIAIFAVIIVAIAGYMVFVPNEDDIYNQQMGIVYDDLQELNAFLNESNTTQAVSNNAQIEEFTTKADNITATADKDIELLRNLNNSISNSTRKEYIGLCVEDLELLKKSVVDLKDGLKIVKDMNGGKISASEALSKISEVDQDMNNTISQGESVENQLKDYESKYPFVLVNGSQSLIPK